MLMEGVLCATIQVCSSTTYSPFLQLTFYQDGYVEPFVEFWFAMERMCMAAAELMENITPKGDNKFKRANNKNTLGAEPEPNFIYFSTKDLINSVCSAVSGCFASSCTEI